MANKQSTEELIVKYNGELNEIDADTFFNSIIPLTAAIQEIERVLAPNHKLNIKIRAPQRGSFEILLLFDQTLLDSLFENISLTKIGVLISILSGILAIRKHLKGEKPVKVEENNHNVSITNSAGQSISVDNRTFNITMNNIVVSDSMDKVFRALNNDKSIDSLGMLSKRKKKLLEIKREEFKDASKSIPLLEEKTKKYQREVELVVFKVVFEPDYKWEFYLNGRPINAKIEDEEYFKERINKGEGFSRGDRLKVDLEVTQIFDDSLNTYIDKTFVVKKVHSHSKGSRPEQLGLYE